MSPSNSVQRCMPLRSTGRVSRVPTHSLRCRATVLDPGKSTVTLADNEPLRAAFQLNYTVGLPKEPISGLITFTCVAAQHLLSTGPISRLLAKLYLRGTRTHWNVPAWPGTQFTWHYSYYSYSFQPTGTLNPSGFENIV